MSAIQLLYQTAIDRPASKVMMINAHADRLLSTLNKQIDQLDLCQHFRPEFNALTQLGLSVSANYQTVDQGYPLILLLPAKNKQQTLAWLAFAMERLSDNGQLLVACANAFGAKSYESALKKLAGNISSTSKSKCRIFSARKTDTLNHALVSEWSEAGQAREIEPLGLISQPGLFSWDHADIGSQLLINQLPQLSGHGMDLCSGYGLLSEYILGHSPEVQSIQLVEADQLALQCAAKNCQPWQQKRELHWLDAVNEPLPKKLDWIVCNPPFHTGQIRDVELGQKIVKRACQSLKPGGQIFLVANRQLPYEHLLRSALKSSEIIIAADGFKVIRGVR